MRRSGGIRITEKRGLYQMKESLQKQESGPFRVLITAAKAVSATRK